MISACSSSADLSTTQEERARILRRSDTFQAAATNGNLYLAGSNAGVIVYSDDEGKTWRRKELDQPSSIVDMAACPDRTFVALDFYKRVWIGDATAKTWNAHPIASPITPLAITCDPQGRLWIVGSYATILSSADRGLTWKSISSGEDVILRTIQFVDANNAIVTGEFGTSLSTTDGGASWQAQPKVPGDFYAYAAHFDDTRSGWLAGLAGTILRTRDGGKNWSSQENRSGATVYAFVRQGTDLYALGDGGKVAVLRGEQWMSYEPAYTASAFLSAGVSVKPGALLVVGAGGVVRVALVGRDSVTATTR